MLNDFTFYSCREKSNRSIVDAKNTFGENLPYIMEARMGGSVVIFNEHYITALRLALTTGCMSAMNAAEEALTMRLIQHENGGNYRDITNNTDEVVVALDKWLHDEVVGNSHSIVNECSSDTTTI
jgi:hypothetical protein